jgi:tripartite-type tricarboxylate transporter receptor subunit TctC
MMRVQTVAAAGLAAVLSGLHPAAPASAESAEEFFKGKTLTYIVSTAPGGGYDTYARLIAGAMEKYLPVDNIVVKNVPGAGHIIGANQIYAAKPDGLTIGTFNTGLVYAQLLERQGVKFDLAKMTYIGKAASDPRVMIMSTKSEIASFDDLKAAKDQVKFASAGPGSASYNETKMLVNVLGLKVKQITGYDGQEGEMAMMRGEVAGQLGSRSSLLPFVENGFGRMILQIGGTLDRGYEAVPLASEVMADGDAKAVAALIASQAELARLTAAPPNVPADRAALLIKAYQSALGDWDLQSQAAKLGRPLDPLYGEEVGRRIQAALNQSPEVVALVASVLSEKGGEIELTSELTKVSDDGKKISFTGTDGATVKSKVSGSRTKVVINVAESKRKKLKAGMTCEISYAPGEKNEPSLLDCK